MYFIDYLGWGNQEPWVYAVQEVERSPRTLARNLERPKYVERPSAGAKMQVRVQGACKSQMQMQMQMQATVMVMVTMLSRSFYFETQDEKQQTMCSRNRRVPGMLANCDGDGDGDGYWARCA